MTSYQRTMMEAKMEFDREMQTKRFVQQVRECDVSETQELVEGWWDELTGERE